MGHDSFMCDMTREVEMQAARGSPPKNGVIALWPNTRVVKCKYYVSQKQNGFNNKIHWYFTHFYISIRGQALFD